MGVIDWNQIHNADVDFIANDEDAAEAYFELLSAVSFCLHFFFTDLSPDSHKTFPQEEQFNQDFFSNHLKYLEKLKRPFTVSFCKCLGL